MGRFELLVLLTGAMACSRPLQATAVQPNPLLLTHHAQQRPQSAPLEIQVGIQDMDALKVIMVNSARFVVVSRDRLRFHVTLEHKWEEYTDVRNWDVWLEDEAGHRYHPDKTDFSKNKNKSDFIDYDRRTAVSNEFGDIERINYDPWKDRVVLRTIDRFRGEGDYTFSAPDLLSHQRRRLTLVMKHDGLEYRYVWSFADGPVRVANYTQGSNGTTQAQYIRPGPLTAGQ
jgi:hypothetical protein